MAHAEPIRWQVEGMTCANCALSINRSLQRGGAQNILVNPISGAVSFQLPEEAGAEKLARDVSALGYRVNAHHGHDHGHTHGDAQPKGWLGTNFRRFLFCLPFTLVLMSHMIPGLHWHFLMDPVVQMVLATPPFLVGLYFFGRSAYRSLRNGAQNMSVLVTLGAVAAFGYSLAGLLMGAGEQYLFFETAATIFTLVFLGEHLEDASVQSTQRALRSLVRKQRVMANMIAFDGDHQEVILPVENTALKVGDLVLINTGEQVPADCKVLWGDAQVSEALLTGESAPIAKGKKDLLVGGSLLESGSLKAQVTAVGGDTVLSRIIQLVQEAQGEKPPVQQLADRISAVFVPAVLIITLLCFGLNWYFLGDLTEALMRSIAVLVIACPCAMGLATPAAIAVGLGRAAKSGILFRQARSLELFKGIRQVVFDKTGTLTTGKFVIKNFATESIDEAEFRSILFSLEKHSAHPLARSIADVWKGTVRHWKTVEEVKGAGVVATDAQGSEYKAGSAAFTGINAQGVPHSLYLTRNGDLLGWVDLEDELRPEAAEVVRYLKARGIRTVLLSGDRRATCEAVANVLGIDEVIAEQTPAQKLDTIARLNAAVPTAMVGDGINDAPALAKATVGISMAEASQLAVQTAGVVLMNSGLKKLPLALGLGRHTYLTIQQNLFWAFIYNIVAIPVAALGLLTPTFGALVMGLSDVVLAANSVRLYWKKVV